MIKEHALNSVHKFIKNKMWFLGLFIPYILQKFSTFLIVAIYISGIFNPFLVSAHINILSITFTCYLLFTIIIAFDAKLRLGIPIIQSVIDSFRIFFCVIIKNIIYKTCTYLFQILIKFLRCITILRFITLILLFLSIYIRIIWNILYKLFNYISFSGLFVIFLIGCIFPISTANIDNIDSFKLAQLSNNLQRIVKENDEAWSWANSKREYFSSVNQQISDLRYKDFNTDPSSISTKIDVKKINELDTKILELSDILDNLDELRKYHDKLINNKSMIESELKKICKKCHATMDKNSEFSVLCNSYIQESKDSLKLYYSDKSKSFDSIFNTFAKIESGLSTKFLESWRKKIDSLKSQNNILTPQLDMAFNKAENAISFYNMSQVKALKSAALSIDMSLDKYQEDLKNLLINFESIYNDFRYVRLQESDNLSIKLMDIDGRLKILNSISDRISMLIENIKKQKGAFDKVKKSSDTIKLMLVMSKTDINQQISLKPSFKPNAKLILSKIDRLIGQFDLFYSDVRNINTKILSLIDKSSNFNNKVSSFSGKYIPLIQADKNKILYKLMLLNILRLIILGIILFIGFTIYRIAKEKKEIKDLKGLDSPIKYLDFAINTKLFYINRCEALKFFVEHLETLHNEYYCLSLSEEDSQKLILEIQNLISTLNEHVILLQRSKSPQDVKIRDIMRTIVLSWETRLSELRNLE